MNQFLISSVQTTSTLHVYAQPFQWITAAGYISIRIIGEARGFQSGINTLIKIYVCSLERRVLSFDEAILANLIAFEYQS